MAWWVLVFFMVWVMAWVSPKVSMVLGGVGGVVFLGWYCFVCWFVSLPRYVVFLRYFFVFLSQ